ncbi:MAG: hypothetical protein M1823_004988 [Watsoniomyces obsoletus]|nr:MAG: hypothetical protein M1823_004988 [Watsoniomyces obsoletus]
MDFYPGDPRMLPASMAERFSSRRHVFDEYYRCYPIVMLPGPERETANHGGKVFLPTSALDKLTRLHISYPMLFELINGAKERVTHAGVLEFIAEEGKIYLPLWIMQTLLLEPGDLLQIKSTDLPLGSFIKLQPQSTSFLDISDPKAVLENVMRNFSCLTTGDVFSFSYNDEIYEMAVLETRPENKAKAISVLETDLEVDFAAPVGYVEPTRGSGTSTPGGGHASGPGAAGGMLHNQGTMAQAINYSSIAPTATAAASGAKAVSSHFLTSGQKLSRTKKLSSSSSRTTPGASSASSPLGSSSGAPGGGNVSAAGESSTAGAGAGGIGSPNKTRRALNGPQPLRLPPGKLFFGYEIKPVQGRQEGTDAGSGSGGDRGDGDDDNNDGGSNGARQMKFQGSGNSLRPSGGTKRKGGNSESGSTMGDGEDGGGGGGKKDETKKDRSGGGAAGKNQGRSLRDTR